ncbi:hypothetical protein, partial [Escherichia coli]
INKLESLPSDRADDYVSRPPDWGKRLEVSCSS